MNKIGKFDDSIYHYKTAIKIEPNFEQAYNNLAVSLFNEGDYGDSCYIVMSGRVQAIINEGQDNEIILGELKKGDVVDYLTENGWYNSTIIE